MIRRSALCSLIASLALLAGTFAPVPASAAVEDFGFNSVGASLSTNAAGAHADFTTTFALNGQPGKEDSFGQLFPWAALRELALYLAPGMTGNPEAIPTCPMAVYVQVLDIANPNLKQCPTDSQVGLVRPGLYEFFPPGILPEPVYNLEPPGGDVVARLGIPAVFYLTVVDIRIDPERDNAITATVAAPTNDIAKVTGAETTIWGVPSDKSHDDERLTPLEAIECFGQCGGPKAVSAKPPFLSNPTSCGPKEIGFALDSYQLPGLGSPVNAPLGEITDCEKVPFNPLLSLKPTTTSAASASGVDFNLSIPQDGLADPDVLASAHLKKAVVTLPEGVGLNASAADGLGSCSQAEIGVVSESPIRFNEQEPSCPESSKVGNGTVTTPVLADPLQGSLYVAKQDDNPFDSLLAGYLVAKGKGVMIKQAGKFDLTETGRITAVFDNNPQQPFSELSLHFKGGARGVLTTPSQCGTYETAYELTPWSGNPPATGVSSFTIDQNCAAGHFDPGFEAGSENPFAGTYSPFSARVTRDSGSPALTGLEISPPRGLVGKLAGVPYCSESALAGISRSLGGGAAQIVSPACSASSQIGSVVAGAGSGSPFYVDTGRVYLAGPYKGAPISLAVVAPAVAGPFDLGNVAVRTALYVDPETVQLRAVSDPWPTFLHGIPLNLRDVRVSVDRSQFALNPTSCAEKSTAGTIKGAGGVFANVTDRFQVGACGDLGFRPRVSLRLLGGTKRGAHPRLRAIVTPRKGDANIGRSVVALPRSEFLDQNHIKTVCTRVQFAADDCPKGSVYGRATATTSLLDGRLSGPVYLRSSDNELPDLVAHLRGQVDVALVGRIDSIRGGIRTTFVAPPDAPVTKFVLTMQGGRKGLLINSRDVCGRAYRADVRMRGQNGLARTLRPELVNSACAKR